MPEKTVTFDGIMSDLRAQRYSPIYYLIGEESYYIDFITDFIVANVLKPEERDFNLTVVFGSDVTAAEVTDIAKRYPMMADRQVIIVKEAQNIKNTEAFEYYFEKPMSSTILVICHKNTKLDKRKKIFSKVEKTGVLFESKKLYENQLVPFIENFLRGKKVTIDGKAAQIVGDSIGSDLSRLVGELNKVIISLPEDNRHITPEIVEKQIGVSKDFNIFELRDAIVNRNIFKANQIVKYFDENPKAAPMVMLLPQLFNLFSNLMIAYYSPRRNAEGLISWLGLGSPSQWIVKKRAEEYLVAMRHYSGGKVMQIISKLREMDCRSKGIGNSNTPSGELMKELIFFIMH